MGELFDIYDETDRHLGTATREEAHARGLWHYTFHCWVVRPGEDGRAWVLLQRRSPWKDTNPGRLDISAAGHLSAGESVSDAAREMEEEIGLRVPFERLVPYGRIRSEASGETAGKPYLDREVSHVFGCRSAEPLSFYRPQPEEVSALYEADADELIRLMKGELGTIGARGLRPAEGGGSVPFEEPIAPDDFVPRDREYYVDVFRFLRELAFSESSS